MSHHNRPIRYEEYEDMVKFVTAQSEFTVPVAARLAILSVGIPNR